MYQRLRSEGILSYTSVEKRFEDHQAKWSEAIFNDDAQFKYLDPLVNPDPGKEPTDVYLPMLQGSKAEQRKWWLYNRFRYMDSKWNAGDALSDVIQLRGYAKADITVTPYADIYPTIKYGSYLVSARGRHGVPQTLVCPLDNVNDTEIYIYSASQLASVGDLSGLKVGFADFSKATKIQSIKVGDGASGYANGNLTGLSVGTNPLLGSVDARNCTALAGTVDLSGAANIEHVFLEGTGVTGVSLPNGGILKTLHLPDSVTNLTLRNQPGITDFVMTDYSGITTLRVENCPTIPVMDILADIPANSRVRIVGLSQAFESTEDVDALYDYLDTMRGIDENGNNLDRAVVSGVITGLDSITGAWLADKKSRYPNIEIKYQHITSYLRYYNFDGSELLYTEQIVDGGNGTYSGAPARSSTAQYTFTFVGWNRNKDAATADENAKKAVTSDRDVYAAYMRTTRTYTVTWKNSNGTTLETDANVPYGSMPQYNGATPTNPDSSGGAFREWTPTVTTVTGNVTYTASYVPSYNVNFYNGSTLLQTAKVLEGGTAVYTGETPVSSEDSSLAFLGWAASAGQNATDANILKNITANKSVYAAFESAWEDVEITDDWATIISKITNGTYKTAYKLGNYKPLDLGTQGIINMQIVAFDTDEYANGGKAPITMIGKELLNSTKSISKTGGSTMTQWSESGLRVYLKDTIKPLIFAAVPALDGAIKDVTKLSNSYYSTEDVWIPSAREAYVVITTNYERSGPMYKIAFKNSAMRIRARNGTNANWWLRTAAGQEYSGGCKYVTSAGNGSANASYNSYGVLIGFCLGDPNEITDSWSDILAAEQAGTYSTKYKVGDYIPLDLGTEGVVNMQIVGMNVDELADDSGNTAPITWISEELLKTTHRMNPSKVDGQEGTGALGGWEKTEMRTYLKETIKSLMPAELSAALKTVKKYTTNYNVSGTKVNNEVSSDDVWIPSARELGFELTGIETTGVKYNSIFTDNASRVKHFVGSSSGFGWWMRSAYSNTNFNNVDYLGGRMSYAAPTQYGVALGFCT